MKLIESSIFESNAQVNVYANSVGIRNCKICSKLKHKLADDVAC